MSLSTKRKAKSEEPARKKSKIEEVKSSFAALDLQYMRGHGGHFDSEALPGALPVGQNNPQKCAYGLFAEQLSGTSFTTPRLKNQKVWLYRIKPTVVHTPFKPYTRNQPKSGGPLVSDFADGVINPDQTRWMPYPLPQPEEKATFIDGLSTVCGAGSVDSKNGVAIHVYTCNTSMVDQAFVNSDGDFLIVPQEGELLVRTELGVLHLPPDYIGVIPRGVSFAVEVTGPSRGYICEIFNGHFHLPELGPIGANGLANPRDFEYPVASYEDRKCKFTVVQKFLGKLFSAEHPRSVFDVVAFHGNYLPYRYDLKTFVALNSVTIDHMDPSIFTVLTAPTNEVGVALLDFVIFPPRWAVQDRTFRPPYYHRNCMSEYMGNIKGRYEAKPTGFLPGGGTLHSCMVGHGPDAATYKKASEGPLKPVKMPEDSMAFMFESHLVFRLTPWADCAQLKDTKYHECWTGLGEDFDPTKP